MGALAVGEREKLRADYVRVRNWLRREQELRLRYWNPDKGQASAAEIAVVLAALRRLGEAVALALDETGRVRE